MQIPADWGAAIDLFASDPTTARIFPEGLIRNFAATKRQELQYFADLSEEERISLYLDTV